MTNKVLRIPDIPLSKKGCEEAFKNDTVKKTLGCTVWIVLVCIPLIILAAFWGTTVGVASVVFGIQGLVVGSNTYKVECQNRYGVWMIVFGSLVVAATVFGCCTGDHHDEDCEEEEFREWLSKVVEEQKHASQSSIGSNDDSSTGSSECCRSKHAAKKAKKQSCCQEEKDCHSKHEHHGGGFFDFLSKLLKLASFGWLCYGINIVYTNPPNPTEICNQSQYEVFQFMVIFMFWSIIALMGICAIACLFTLPVAFFVKKEVFPKIVTHIVDADEKDAIPLNKEDEKLDMEMGIKQAVPVAFKVSNQVLNPAAAAAV